MPLSAALTSAEARIVIQLAEALERSTLRFLDIESGSFRIRLAKDSSQLELMTKPTCPTENATAMEAILVTAPAVGIYRAFNGGGPRVGMSIDTNFLLGHVETLDVINHVTSAGSGTIIEECVDDGDFVEYGQLLLKVQPRVP